MTDYNDTLTTRLRQAASYETLPTDPAALVRRRAERGRARRRAGAATLGIAAAIAGAVVFQQASAGDGLFETRVDQSASRPPQPTGPTPPSSVASDPASGSGQSPTRTPQTDRPVVASSATGSPDAADDAPQASITTAWPAPPTSLVAQPWTRTGYDYGDVVAARMEDGHAVITFDRVQLFTAEQWEQRTGEPWEFDFRALNESTRTRQFVVEDDALLSGNWLLTNSNQVDQRYTPRELVARLNAALVKQATSGAERPSVPVFLFHRDRLDGTVAYLEEATAYTG
jgi:hypothetical protein